MGITQAETPEFIDLNDPHSSESSNQLKGQMGTFTLTMTVLAFTAPLVVVSGFAPFIIEAGGLGAPVAFILTTLLMLLFSIGFLTMAKHSSRPRNFYLFIREGLGKNMGLGAAFMSITSYLMLMVGTYVLCGVSISALLSSFGVAEVPWWLLSFIGWAIVSTIGYFQVDVSAKIMCIIMFI